MRPPKFDLPGIWEPAGDTPGKADPVLPRDGEAPIGAWNKLLDLDPDLFADELIWSVILWVFIDFDLII